jgi:hypothetical protein
VSAPFDRKAQHATPTGRVAESESMKTKGDLESQHVALRRLHGDVDGLSLEREGFERRGSDEEERIWCGITGDELFTGQRIVGLNAGFQGGEIQSSEWRGKGCRDQHDEPHGNNP